MRHAANKLVVGQKYDLFGESDKAKKELEKFKINFELLQTELGSLESQCKDELNRRDEIKSQVEQLNEVARQLSRMPGVRIVATLPANNTTKQVCPGPAEMLQASAIQLRGSRQQYRQQQQQQQQVKNFTVQHF